MKTYCLKVKGDIHPFWLRNNKGPFVVPADNNELVVNGLRLTCNEETLPQNELMKVWIEQDGFFYGALVSDIEIQERAQQEMKEGEQKEREALDREMREIYVVKAQKAVSACARKDDPSGLKMLEDTFRWLTKEKKQSGRKFSDEKYARLSAISDAQAVISGFLFETLS
jgi:hypothetical protein